VVVERHRAGERRHVAVVHDDEGHAHFAPQPRKQVPDLVTLGLRDSAEQRRHERHASARRSHVGEEAVVGENRRAETRVELGTDGRFGERKGQDGGLAGCHGRHSANLHHVSYVSLDMPFHLPLAVRALLKDRGFTAAAATTLVVCIAANVVLFSIVHSVLLKPLPVPDADRLVFLYNSYPGAGAERGSSGVPDYFDRVAGLKALESLALYDTRNRSTGESGRPERITAMEVTPSFFRVARVKAALGRTFSEDEGEVGRNDRVVLSYGYWQERYGGDRSVVGREMRIDGRPCTIVGVMPASFTFLESDARVWTPLAFTPEQRSDEARHDNSWNSIGRLGDGATIAQATAQVKALNAAAMDRIPELKPLLINAGFNTRIVPLKDDLVRNVKGRLYLLWGGTLFVLLIGCVNVINLALVRARVRLRDLATRLSLGASRSAIARQVWSESLLLTVGSGLVGLLVGWWCLRALTALDLGQIPRGVEIGLGVVPVLFTIGLSALLGLVIGAFPLATVFSVNLSSVFHEGGRTGTGGRGPRMLRRALVVTQVAVAFLLLIGTGLLLASFRQILAIDPGFDQRQVLTASIRLPGSRYPTDKEIRAFTDQALRRIRAIAGVASAGATSAIPLGDDHSDSVIFAEGYQMQPGESVISPTRVEVSPGYFESLRIPLVRGRYFDDRDGADSPPAIMVDARLAAKFWPGQNPIGRRMYRPESAKDVTGTNDKTRFLTVVGVVGEVKMEGLVAAKTPVGAYYLPMSQQTVRLITFTLRAAGEPEALAPSLRAALGAVDPELPVFAVKTMEQVTDESLVTRRWPMLLSTGFGVVALLLSALGIYGVLAYLVTQRTKEIGVRMALGGSPRAIFDLVLQEGLALLGVGFVVGGIGLAAVRRVLDAQLYGVGPGNPAVMLLAALLLGVAALVACAIPARRATRIDPVIALSAE
jgi:putative ABC transport system permease protein